MQIPFKAMGFGSPSTHLETSHMHPEHVSHPCPLVQPYFLRSSLSTALGRIIEEVGQKSIQPENMEMKGVGFSSTNER